MTASTPTRPRPPNSFPPEWPLTLDTIGLPARIQGNLKKMVLYFVQHFKAATDKTDLVQSFMASMDTLKMVAAGHHVV